MCAAKVFREDNSEQKKKFVESIELSMFVSHKAKKKPEKFDLMNKWFNDLMNNEYLEY